MRRTTIIILSLLAVFSFTLSTAFAGLGIRLTTLTSSVGTPTTADATSTSAVMASASTATFTAAASSSCVAPDPTIQVELCFVLTHVATTAVRVDAIVDGSVTVVCTNPGGNNPPGQQFPIHTTTSGSFFSDDNGNVKGELTVTLQNIPTCPASMVRSFDAHFQTLEFKVFQPPTASTPVIDQFFNFPPN